MIKSLLKKIFDYLLLGNVGPHRGNKRISTKIVVSMVSSRDQFNIDEYVSAAMLNISIDGICIESQKPFILGESIFINISLPSGQQFQVSGTIIRIEDLQCSYLYGVIIPPLYENTMKQLIYFFRLK
ncbi:MAG: PilZ domain-containing protein [Elusimicrobia bacterium]|nr:PilZ domain-containing protein [Elusimicrobiota bacterium]